MRAPHSHHTLPAASHCVCVCVCAPLRQVALISASCARLPLALGHKVFKVLGTRSLAQGLSGLWHKVFKVFGKVFGGEGFLPQPAHTLLGLLSLQGEEWAACTRVPYIGSLVSTPTPAVGGSAGGASGYAPRRVLDRSALVLREAPSHARSPQSPAAAARRPTRASAHARSGPCATATPAVSTHASCHRHHRCQSAAPLPLLRLVLIPANSYSREEWRCSSRARARTRLAMGPTRASGAAASGTGKAYWSTPAAAGACSTRAAEAAWTREAAGDQQRSGAWRRAPGQD